MKSDAKNAGKAMNPQKEIMKAGAQLQWHQPHALRRHYELRSDDETLATLDFPTIFRSEAKAQSKGGCWEFRQKGFWNRRIEVRECGNELPSATYVRRALLRKGTLQLPMGRTALFAMSMWGTKAEMTTEKGDVLFSLKLRGIFRSGANVDVYEMAGSYKESEWMLLLAWYLVLMEKRRRAHTAS